jgi:tetratricopeptide (TPR) repeat protein
VQLVYSPPNWDLSDRTWVLNQHINVTGTVKGSISMGESRNRVALPSHTGTIIKPDFMLDTFIKYVVDLNPKLVVNAYRTEVLDDHQFASRFYGNLAAQALLEENYTDAYLYNKQAINFDKLSSLAWNNLGVLYSRIDQPDLARKSYLTAIQVDPDADAARNNLASLYRKVGNTSEANQLDQGITQRRKKNPYYHYYLGEDLLKVGDYEEAIDYFRQAIRRKKDEQLFYLSMAEAQLELDQIRDAERSLNKAEKYAEKANSERYVQLTKALLSEKRDHSL